jgi:A/G-specific adenine glycosylase
MPQHAEDGLRAGAARRRTVAPRLLSWFDRNQRDLPWRRDRDPYRIWVSEVMLQQTQVATVLAYFERFLARFPTPADLAAASEHDVLLLWEGLGYYRRARDLHGAARIIVAEHAGQLPNDPAMLKQLPGFGEYTCNAVLSQAFDQRLPILEANSQRLLSRLFGRTGDPREGPARRWLWSAAAGLLPAQRVGAFNQALMELGSLLCTPTTPKCSQCPLAKQCVAFREGKQEEIPVRARSSASTPVREVAVVVRRAGRVLLVRRPDHGRWSGMWEFPRAEPRDAETEETAARRIVHELTGLRTRIGPELLTIRHGVTRFAITLVCFEAEHLRGEFASAFYREGAWLLPDELARYPVSAPQRRLAKALLQPDRQRRLF